jgi:hypothetical protein
MCYTCAQIVTQSPTLLGYGDVFVHVSLCTRFAIVFSLSFSNMHTQRSAGETLAWPLPLSLTWGLPEAC